MYQETILCTEIKRDCKFFLVTSESQVRYFESVYKSSVLSWCGMSVLHWIVEELSVAMDCKSFILSFEYYIVTHSYSSCLFLCALGLYTNILSNIVLATCYAVY